MKSTKNNVRRIFLVIFLILIAGASIIGFKIYGNLYAQNISTTKSTYLFLKSGTTYEVLIDSLSKNNQLNDIESFKNASKFKRFVKIKPGKYKLTDGMSNNDLINKLRSGNQDPVNVVLYGIRKKEELAGKVAKKLDIDSLEFVAFLNDKNKLSKYGLNPDNILTVFIPNTYQLFWNSSIEDFMNKMGDAYKKFWTEDRKNKAQNIGLDQTEVSVLASIIQSESTRKDDKPIIAGVYLNRLQKGMPLEADPTLVWALNDFSIKRVLNKHKKIDSPYNTYMYKGLPPGPITLPSIESLDAVLNAQKHNYLYFCAKEDFSGYSNFAETLTEHLKNAKKYQKALSERGILK